MRVPHDEVAGASAAWNWYPPDARVVETEEFLLVRFPDWFYSPLELLRFTPTRPTREVMPEVLKHAAGLDADSVAVWVKLDAPADLDPWLEARGAEVEETLDVFAAPLVPAVPEVPVPADVAVRQVRDVPALQRFEEVRTAVFGGSVPPPERLAEAVRELEEEFDSGSGRWVAEVEGRAVGVGGLSVAGPAARLWGGAVRLEARGRGVYRALLATRLAEGAAHGCTMALVKGRVETSGPVLRRAGFEVHGQERLRRLRLA